MTTPIFSYNADIERNAYLNWRTDKNDQSSNLFVFASDYADAAIALINTILEDNRDKKADALIMPILYDIDQSIELYIKAIIRRIEELNGNQISVYKTHDIYALERELVSKIKRKESTSKGLDKHLSPVTAFIDELYQKIKGKVDNGRVEINIDFARYPFNVDGVAHFYINEDDNVVIDVENLGHRFSKIRDSLEALYLMYDNEKEQSY